LVGKAVSIWVPSKRLYASYLGIWNHQMTLFTQFSRLSTKYKDLSVKKHNTFLPLYFGFMSSKVLNPKPYSHVMLLFSIFIYQNKIRVKRLRKTFELLEYFTKIFASISFFTFFPEIYIHFISKILVGLELN
jgi:hypothetical protein